ncbi:MAG: hypothetical protein KC478_09465 [Bacteriovoracaceae bacterium]|nr:hypothetical protein [Bacteriovoracaceae bacterium]
MDIIKRFSPHDFDPENHFYTKVLNAQLHPLVSYFYNLGNDRIAQRYCHLNPQVDRKALDRLLNYKTSHFHWGGSDLFYTTTKTGNRKVVVIETNSCPSGQKSMPLANENIEQGGYHTLITQCFKNQLERSLKTEGGLAVLYDKNYMEASGYAATMADVFDEEVFLVPLMSDEKNEHIKFDDGVLNVFVDNEWRPIRGALRYVTQRPWSRIPLVSKTLILNPVIACLAGGRNKLVASKAYELFNAQHAEFGIGINFPETVKDLNKEETKLWVERFDYLAVIKVPYSNAGQGVYTISNKEEFEEFLKIDFPYEQFIVQSLIAPRDWYPRLTDNKFFHVGTFPNKRNEIFVADLRMMVINNDKTGFSPIATYARRAKAPLTDTLPENSWDMLGTNLSIKLSNNEWSSDSKRLMLVDRKEFNTLGLGLDDMIEAYIQSALSVVAIDKICEQLLSDDKFNEDLFTSLNNDKVLLEEFYNG